jgi:hypothetical protein
LKLAYKGKPLNDDSVLISDLHYPIYEENVWFPYFNDTIDVETLGARYYRNRCNDFFFMRSLHDGTTLRRLKTVIANEHFLPYSAISIDLTGHIYARPRESQSRRRLQRSVFRSESAIGTRTQY